MSKKKNEENAGADEQLEEEKAKPEPEPVKEFKINKGLNAYGFVHIPKKARPSLPFEQGVPLKAKIQGRALVLQEE